MALGLPQLEPRLQVFSISTKESELLSITSSLGRRKETRAVVVTLTYLFHDNALDRGVAQGAAEVVLNSYTKVNEEISLSLGAVVDDVQWRVGDFQRISTLRPKPIVREVFQGAGYDPDTR